MWLDAVVLGQVAEGNVTVMVMSAAQDNMQCVVHMRLYSERWSVHKTNKWWCREVHQTIMWCVVHRRGSSWWCTRRCVVLQCGDGVAVW